MNQRGVALALLLLVSLPAVAQYQTPTIDGTINVGEYANSSGNWHMTWDATFLYVAHNLKNPVDQEMVVYVDVDPLSTPAGGSASNGNLTGTTELGITPSLPFRADARSARTCGDCGGVTGLRRRDDAGSWTAENTDINDIQTATNGSTIEMRIRWSAMRGGAGDVPSSFAWLAFLIDTNSGNAVQSPMPTSNPAGLGTSPSLPYFFSIAATTDGAATNPFSVQQSTWRVTSNADSGSNTLRDAITNANADATSSRRYITFGLGDTTISTSDLPRIVTTTTVDGTSQTGGTTPAVTLVGFSATTAEGLFVQAGNNCVIRGMILQTYRNGIIITGGTNHTIAGNYIGTNAAGTAAVPNETGIFLGGTCPGCSIGGTTAADRNVISGNLSVGIDAEAVGFTVQGNYIGTNASGDAAIANGIGVRLSGDPPGMTVGGAGGARNVISGNTGNGAEDFGSIGYFNNYIGLTANGGPLGNGGFGIASLDNVPNKVVGSIALPNTIAHNAGAVQAKNTGGFLIRGNKIFGNTASSITVSNVVQPAPTVNSAVVSANSLNINFSLSATMLHTSLQVDLYLADTTNAIAQPASYIATSPCYSGDTLTNQDWAVGSGYLAGGKYVLIATSYTDGSCVTAGDGSSANTAIFTSTAPHTFTGPGNFSDTSKWSGNALPPASEDFLIVGSCTFDNASPVRAYGDMTLGDGTSTGSIAWQAGNTVVLDVDDVARAATGTSGVLVDMTNAGTLRVRGNFSLGTGELTGGSGTVEFTGIGKTVTSGAAIFHNVTITGSLTIATTFYFDGTLDVQTGGSFSGSSSTFLRPQNGATITGSGTKAFRQVEIDAGMTVTASGNFSVSTFFTIDGTFTPTASTVISGTGTLNGSGTMKVTRTGSNAIANQYAMTSIDTTSNTVEYAGSANQNMNPRTYKNLTINNPVSVTLNGNTTVTGILNFAQGLAMGAGNEFFVTDSSPSAVVQGTGWTRLILHRAIATGTNTYLFPIGTGGSSQPVNITFNNVTVAGQVKMQAPTISAQSLQAGSGLDSSKDVGNIWRFGNETAAFSSYDITINFGTSHDVGATPTAFVLRAIPSPGGPWFNVPATPTATSITATGQTLLDHFYATGNQEIDHYVVTAASPQSAGTPFTTTVVAQDILNVTANNSTTVVTMSNNPGNAQYDSDGNGTFGENTKTLTNGAFTISTKDNTIESVTITATDSNSKTGSAIVTVNLGPASGATTTIGANPTTILANGQETSTITVQTKDAGGNNISSSAGTLILSTDLGTLGTVTDNNDGTYTATFRAGTVGGTATVSGTINAIAITDTAAVTLTNVPFGTPATITATATGTSQVQLSWTGVSGATTYEVFRSSLNSAYTLFLSTGSLDAFDSTVTANTTFLYKVRAIGTGGTSAFSAVDPATTIIFTDTNISGVTIKAVHLTQLRTAVNAMRAAAGLSASTFTDVSLAAGTPIKATHITELRTAVDAARNVIGPALPIFTDPTITAGTTKAKAVHITELRQRVQ